jgi:hypothetical protein
MGWLPSALKAVPRHSLIRLENALHVYLALFPNSAKYTTNAHL